MLFIKITCSYATLPKHSPLHKTLVSPKSLTALLYVHLYDAKLSLCLDATNLSLFRSFAVSPQTRAYS